MFGEGKYGPVENLSERLKLLPGEPYFILRGKDLLAPAAVEAYANLLEAAGHAIAKVGDPPDAPHEVRTLELWEGARDINEFANKMRVWQADNPGAVKLPD